MATYVTGRMVQDQSIDSNDLTQQAAIPPGAVMSFAMSAAPVGWLPCDGAAINRTTYSALFAVVRTIHGAGDGSNTFNVPDLRGEFIRGWSAGRNVGGQATRTFGSYEEDAIRNIIGEFKVAGTTGGIDGVAGVFNIKNQPTGYPAQAVASNNTVGYGQFNASRVVPTAEDNRPRNIALLYCIKF